MWSWGSRRWKGKMKFTNLKGRGHIISTVANCICTDWGMPKAEARCATPGIGRFQIEKPRFASEKHKVVVILLACDMITGKSYHGCRKNELPLTIEAFNIVFANTSSCFHITFICAAGRITGAGPGRWKHGVSQWGKKGWNEVPLFSQSFASHVNRVTFHTIGWNDTYKLLDLDFHI